MWKGKGLEIRTIINDCTRVCSEMFRSAASFVQPHSCLFLFLRRDCVYLKELDKSPNRGRHSGAHVPTDIYKPLSGIPWYRKPGEEAFGLSQPGHRDRSTHSDIYSCSRVQLAHYRRPQWKVPLDTELLICLSPSQANKSGQLSWHTGNPKPQEVGFCFGFVKYIIGSKPYREK